MVLTVPQNLVKFGQEVKKRHTFCEIQDGCWRHIEKYTSCSAAILRIEFPVPEFQSEM